jgi:hypothetical protein
VSIAATFGIVAAQALATASPPKQPLTVTDAIQTTRAMTDFQRDGTLGQRTNRRGSLTSFIAPTGDRYAVMLVTGDVVRNGNWVTVYTGKVSAKSVDKPTLRYRGFTSSLGGGGGGRRGDGELVLPGHNPLRWLPSGREVSFFWPDATGRRQVLAVHVDSGTQRYLTASDTDVMEFSVRSDGLIFYASREPTSSFEHEEAERRGFVVSNVDALSLLRGEFNGGSIYDSLCNNRRFIKPVEGELVPVKPEGSPVNRFLPIDDRVPPKFSPDHRFAVYARTPDVVPKAWDNYTEGFTQLSVQATRNGIEVYSRQLQQLFLLDLRSGAARPLWDSPLLWYPDWKSKPVNLNWSPNSEELLIAPTFLPAALGYSAGMTGDAVATVNILDGSVSLLPLQPQASGFELTRATWKNQETIEVHTTTGSMLTYQRRKNLWRLVSTQRAPETRAASPAVTIEIRQSANDPPKLYAHFNHARRDQLLLDLNPGLTSAFELGKVVPYTWRDTEARVWSGRLYYPTNFKEGSRFPLVIQTHGYAKLDEFSLTGLGESEGHPGLGTGISIFAAQPLANRGMFVLQVEDRQEHLGTLQEAVMFADAYEKAIDALDADGLIDRARVGLSGFSRTGWNVEYALTHSSFAYRAAIVSDNIDAGYLQWLLNPGYGESENEAQPFGDGLKTWLERAPAFNVEKIRTPLRIQVESGTESILAHGWEMFVRLRQLNRPVEMVVIPDISHGSHNIQNPRQALFSQEGTVEWFNYWLNGTETVDPAKGDQYRRWARLRNLENARHEAEAALAH